MPFQPERQQEIEQYFAMTRDPAQQEALARAEESARQQRLAAGLGQAGATIGAAIGGTQADTSFYDNLRQQANQGVDQVRQQGSQDEQRRMQIAQYLGNRQDQESRAMLASQDKQADRELKERLAGFKAKGSAEKAPTGYRFLADGSLEAIPGGPAYEKMAERDQKAEMRQKETARAAQTVVEDLGRAMDIIEGSYFAAGPIVGHTAKLSGTPANKTTKLIDSVKSNIGIDRLQAMRDSSPTGGALGQVPFQQQQRLEQLLGSLDVTQPQDMLLDNMKRISNTYNDIIHGEGQGPERYALGFDSSGRPVERSRWLSGTAIAGDQPQPFPRQVRKDGQVATVANEQELAEAQSDGWK